MTYNGFTKPSARLVSQEIMATPNITLHENYTDLVMVWGQYFDHDTDLTPKTDSLCQERCVQKAPYCFPIFASNNDSRLADDGCISLTRSTRVCNLEPREQLNSVTSYVDASTVYGSTEERAMYLRDLTTDLGHLRTGISVNVYGKVSKTLLPFKHQMAQGCNRPTMDDTGIPCFFAGDVRANEHLGLIAIHTVWVREHNRIADELKLINPHWNGETIYQEARKIVGALHQIISFDHWLPKIVGSKGMELLGSYNGYEPLVEASTVNSFATAAFRFGHGQISPTVVRLGADFNESSDGNLLLHDAAFCPFRIVNEGSIDPVLRGMFGTALKNMDPAEIMSEEVTESLFKLTTHVAFDLASLNTQRGRDHGLPGYNQWRQFCNLPIADTFDDLANEISNAELRQKLQDLYGHPDNIDLFVAGLVEDPWYDSIVGPTFTCLIAHQFRSWRTGDRYWYQHSGEFTSDQIIELEKHSLARILCDSGDDIQQVQNDVFQRAIYPDGYQSCDQIPSMNLTIAWMDSGDDDCT
ncbi:peroxidasin-like [Amphiura filiformis]|uniref:peroxidasin-like n=1 Tax=Amphiura filiformis TaxID=82378 RepID=UPI003B225251